MSWRLYRPRRIGAYEAEIIRRLLQVGAEYPLSRQLLTSIAGLMVNEEGGGGFEYDSLDFIDTRDHGTIIAGAIGVMPNDAQVELVLWARGDTITRLELEPFNGARLPIRMPILESIRPYPPDVHLYDGSSEVAAEPADCLPAPRVTSR